MALNESVDEISFDNSEISLSRSVRFWLLLCCDIPSIVCTFLILYHLLRDSKRRQALHNHAIILILLLGTTTQLIEIPFYLAFIGDSGVVKPSVPATCLAWWFVSFGMYNGGTILMAWASIERHILVFNSIWVHTNRGRFFVHYFPLIFILLYIGIYYIYVLFFFPCENEYDYTLPICNASPCYQDNQFLGMWDFIVNNIAPSLLIALASWGLVLRVIRQKRRLNQQTQWRRQRKMTIQLASLSALNIIFNIPLNILSLAHLCGLPDDYGVDAEKNFYFSCYFLIFLFPFVCLISYSDLICRIKSIVTCRKNRQNAAVVPSVWITNRHT
mgnify:FL=1